MTGQKRQRRLCAVATVDPERDFRAVLAHALRVRGPRRPGPQGIPIIELPADGDLIAEAYRLRRLVDEIEGREKPRSGRSDDSAAEPDARGTP